jgi:hypothetical protein
MLEPTTLTLAPAGGRKVKHTRITASVHFHMLAGLATAACQSHGGLTVTPAAGIEAPPK